MRLVKRYLTAGVSTTLCRAANGVFLLGKCFSSGIFAKTVKRIDDFARYQRQKCKFLRKIRKNLKNFADRQNIYFLQRILRNKMEDTQKIQADGGTTEAAVLQAASDLTSGNKVKEYFTYNIPGKRKRVWELDLIRGLIMLVVTFDHVARFSYYWGIIQYKTAFGHAIESVVDAYFQSYFANNFYVYGLWLLCFMSGISCQFSRSSATRLAKLWIGTVVLMGGYLAAHFILPDKVVGYVWFGIVTVLTISATVWYFLDKIRVPDWGKLLFGAVVALGGVVVYYYNKYSAEGLFVDNPFLALLIYNGNGYKVSPNNFEPLIPHLGFFVLGGVFGRHFYADKHTLLKREDPPKWLTPVMLLGKHSFAAYLVLPELCIGILWLIVNFIGLFL